MAGAGYKLFATGDVLTASDVNTYLMQQTVMVFADAAARTTALSGVVAEGMLSYLKDTNAVEVYNGSSWVASDDPNAIQNTIVDAKGDLITATGADTPARLAVGSNGDTLVADSATATGLNYKPLDAAGKNAGINGSAEVWQRGTSFTANGYTADRWFLTTPGSNTLSRSTTVPTGFNYSLNWITAGAYPVLATYVELPVTGAKGNFTGNWVMSFYAKASTASTVSTDVSWADGSSRTNLVTIATQGNSLTTSWQRFTVPVNFNASSPVGTSKAIEINFYIISGGATINITGVQLEIGSTATAFSRAGGTIQGELAACQRYYYRNTATGVDSAFYTGFMRGTTTVVVGVNYPVPMRIAPTAVESSSLSFNRFDGTAFAMTSVTTSASTCSQNGMQLSATVTGGTAGNGGVILAASSASAFLGFSAEL
jgi:hypothetical protein